MGDTVPKKLGFVLIILGALELGWAGWQTYLLGEASSGLGIGCRGDVLRDPRNGLLFSNDAYRRCGSDVLHAGSGAHGRFPIRNRHLESGLGSTKSQ